MKKKYKVLFLIIINILFIFITSFVVLSGNKIGTFFNVAAGEMAHLYIPSNLIYIEGSYFTLDREISLEENKNSNGIYLSKDNTFSQKNKNFFLNFSNAFYVPIELQIDDLIKEKYENQKKKNEGKLSKENYLSDNLLKEDLIQLDNYEFTAPTSGKYDIFVLEESALNQGNGVILLFDDQIIEKNSYQINNKKFILWGQVYLNTGQHKFKVEKDNVPIEFIKSSEIILSLKSPITLNSNSLKFAKINPTKYIVNVKNIKKGPFLLVFLESFDKDWRIFKIANDDRQYFWSNWFKQSNFENNHYLINGFANSWWIDQSDPGSEETFVIEYTRQKNFYFALFTVFLTLLFCVNYLIVKNLNICQKK